MRFGTNAENKGAIGSPNKVTGVVVQSNWVAIATIRYNCVYEGSYVPTEESH